MAENTFHASVVTPERAVLETEARLVVIPAHDGEIGIMRGHSPLLVRLGIGALRVQAADGERTTLFVDGGFAQVVDNRLTVLTEQAKKPSELDAGLTTELLEQARALPAGQARHDALERARIQARMASRSAGG